MIGTFVVVYGIGFLMTLLFMNFLDAYAKASDPECEDVPIFLNSIMWPVFVPILVCMLIGDWVGKRL